MNEMNDEGVGRLMAICFLVTHLANVAGVRRPLAASILRQIEVMLPEGKRHATEHAEVQVYEIVLALLREVPGK